MHYTCLVDEQTEKPYAILYYNANKCGVDTMDQMLGTYSCKRATQRWPLAMFYNMVDVAALAAFTIYNEMKPIKRSDRRRSFLLLLTKQLAVPNIEERALNNHITSYPRIRNAMEAFDVRVLPRPMEGNVPSFAARSSRPSCRLCRSEYGRQRKSRHTASAAATLFAENIAHFYIAATLAHRAGDKKYTLNNNKF
ncbi:uncharacterized protein LOC142235097 isoform X1 [Haematobia irritans]|uniref:uncharacterized protein LOC142235097 isoform X1 n=1 Tax=Haematobia irritans TaxID=7368 RepID=UPI003F508616